MAKKAKAEKTEKTPKSKPLPGMEEAIHTRLNTLCEQISETRAQVNQLRGEDNDLCRHALAYMHDNKVRTYRFAGVELARVPGEEKLRVRTSKEAATTEVEQADDATE
ncbi:hypothetical protein UFOVP1601_16 [uncultured Caudovirales phage]|uniref:Uncharacterized protein n=1 Tax=uncultured Caudovirales phage TaxID=2100421 RepID=A0A6J5RRJ2_9CAUD|nr:hypothetical protein UFOVP1154_26 [uncultured Caudovirales phage]CAB4199893.1 hypothetical protein UFOVP1341_11 [uncultured Caudovirales phage]CAB4218398.1 hypothetical protein UFOVP1601_16 [uncultured Caudovirales phage]